ncbi:hypothetical protein [Candidatus Tisiphia endosymbiont of Ptychoptera albimana]|uniref:hypothetical protein n=1 Tax=Candidatus Tisiphia endosymbiont of Ptychoptera albimana TaxID=3066260 RepID=UPI00312C85B5
MYFIECSEKLKQVYRKGFITKEKQQKLQNSESKFQKLSSALKQNIARRKNSQKVHIEDKNKSENN